MSYSGGKRKHYLKCLAELDEWGYVHRSFFPAHVKWGERNSRPRAIVPQAAKCLGQGKPGDEFYTKAGEPLLIPILVESPVRRAIEQALHSMRNWDGSRMFASGRSLAQRVADIARMFVGGWTCWSIDCSSFDGSQGDLAIWERQACLDFAKRMGIEHYRELKKVFREQDRLAVKSDEVRASIYGNRASGTAGTSVANKLVMMAALFHAMGRAYDAKMVKFYCDGDDTLIFVRNDALYLESSWMRRLSSLGLDVVVENRATRLEDIVFCRSKPVEYGLGRAMLVKKPGDAFKTMCAVVRHFKGSALVDYFATMRDGYNRLWAGVPVMYKLANVFGTQGRVNLKLLSRDEEYARRLLVGMPTDVPITYESRRSFQEAFGISVAAQLEIEALCDEVGASVPAQARQFVLDRREFVTMTY